MQKNTVMFVIFSSVFLFIWYMFFQPKQIDQKMILQNQQNVVQIKNKEQTSQNILDKQDVFSKEQKLNVQNIKEEEITLETEKYKVIFSNKGAPGD